MSYEVICADVLDWAASYDGPKYHALLCDPPYELAFMGKDWDKSGIAFNPDTWAALAEHLHPGAFGMAFASARGWHRLACAIEDAGLRIHPSIFGWAQGSGFPKATRVLKKEWKDTDIPNPNHRESMGQWRAMEGRPDEQQNTKPMLTAPATPLAQAWAGHRYGLQALKPALEPIIVFQVPYSGRPVDSIVETGAGALWVDGGRIGTGEDTSRKRNLAIQGGNWIAGEFETDGVMAGGHPQGRWPANLVLTHLPGCERMGVKRVRGGNGVRGSDQDGVMAAQGINKMHRKGRKDLGQEVGYADPDGTEQVADWSCVEGCPVKALGEQSGERPSRGEYTRSQEKPPTPNDGLFGDRGGSNRRNDYANDTGTAARFYYQASWQYEVAERLADADPVRYVAKAARKERDSGLEEMPLRQGGTMDGGHTVSEGRTAPKTGRVKVRNPHPTVKPIALTRWLATLLLPPDAYAPRRLLVPFAGSGSEMIGAGLVGWEEITGIEFDADTCAIAQARLEHWLNRVQLEMGL